MYIIIQLGHDGINHTHLNNESSLHRVKHFFSLGGRMTGGQLNLVRFEGPKQRLFLLGGQDVSTMQGAVENSGPL